MAAAEARRSRRMARRAHAATTKGKQSGCSVYIPYLDNLEISHYIKNADIVSIYALFGDFLCIVILLK